MLSSRAIKSLAALLEGDQPDSNGEWPMHCPYHGDHNRSASLNTSTGEWFCHGCGEVGDVRKLIRDKEDWIIAADTGPTKQAGGKAEPQPISEGQIEGWHSALMAAKPQVQALRERRSLVNKTIKNYQLGWDADTSAYTIPIRNFIGEVINVRRYQLDVPEGRRKIWSVNGMGTPVLWPLDQLDYQAIVVCEGEMDAMLTIQNGIPAITRTGAADVWGRNWSRMFTGKRVYVCHDMDSKGQLANLKIAASLRQHAAAVTVVALPYPVTDDHGKDLTDFWQDGNTREDFLNLCRSAGTPVITVEEVHDEAPTMVSVNVMGSFDASLVERPLSMSVTVVGKKIPSYLVPNKVMFTCDVGAGKKCENCYLSMGKPAPGALEVEIPADSATILGLLDVPDSKVMEQIRKSAGIVKCPRFDMDVQTHRTIEEIYVRPSLEDAPDETIEQDFTHRKVISAGSHDLASNQSIVITGTIRPNPNNQTNEFQAWKVERPISNLDNFVVTEEIQDEMLEFQSSDPLSTCKGIAADLAEHHTNVYNRDLMHVFMDLVFHSIVEFPFRGGVEPRGWLDAIVVGDTRTGKSKAAEMLIKLYLAGEMISCESASYAGVVGGLDRTSDGKWIVKWGSIPINDRRLVVLDEVSGLQPEQIAQMSSIRSTGLAQLTKIQNEQSRARTRLLWIANPRDARMDDFTYGVQALAPLIGNPEDIARFDMAMGTFSEDVSASTINSMRKERQGRLHSVEAYRAMCRWAWTRKKEHIRWQRGTEEFVLKQATKLGEHYVENPPLIQGANAKEKIARIAVAFAARTYSTNATGQHLIIGQHHVTAAVSFLDEIYSHQQFGYSMVSRQRNHDAANTINNMDEIRHYIASYPSLMRFLTGSPAFSRNNMETMMNTSREEAGSIINKLWELNAVLYENNQVKLDPQVLKELRGTLIG